jgi:large subunit ribosomal protein L29
VKARDIRRRDGPDLVQEIKRLQDEVFERRFHGANEEKADRGLVRKNRRDVARIHTVLRARALGREAAPVAGGTKKEASSS